MIDRKLFIRLVLPLVTVAVIGIFLIWPPRVEDLLYNFIIEIISILITVLFVDWRIKTHENEKWKQVDTLIKADFAAWSMKFIAETSMFLVRGGVTLPESGKFKSTEKPWGFALEYVSFDDVYSAVFDTDNEDRESYASSLQSMLEDVLNLYTRHSSRLSSTDIESILDLESSLRSTINQMKLIDDETTLLNLADGNSAKVDSVWTKQVENTVKSLHETISLAIQIFGKFFPVAK